MDSRTASRVLSTGSQTPSTIRVRRSTSSEYNPLNITLVRHGGKLLDQIAVNARFSTSSSVFRLIVNETANCTMQGYSWAIPADLDTTNPRYLIGLFNASVDIGTNGNMLYGWQAWSPLFWVREESTSSSPTATAPSTMASSATSPWTSTATTPPAATLPPDDSSDSTDIKIGVGVGVGVGGAIILALVLAWFFRRRRKKSRQGQVGAMPPPAPTGPAELTGSEIVEAPIVPRRKVYEIQG